MPSSGDRAGEGELDVVPAGHPDGRLIATFEPRDRPEQSEPAGRAVDDPPRVRRVLARHVVDRRREVQRDPEAGPAPGAFDEGPDREDPQQDEQHRGDAGGEPGHPVARAGVEHHARCRGGGDQRQPHEGSGRHGSPGRAHATAHRGCRRGQGAGQGVETGDQVAHRRRAGAGGQVRCQPPQHGGRDDEHREGGLAAAGRRAAGEQDEGGEPQRDGPARQRPQEQAGRDGPRPPVRARRAGGVGQVRGRGALAGRGVGPVAVGRHRSGSACDRQVDRRPDRSLGRALSQPGAEWSTRREGVVAHQRGPDHRGVGFPAPQPGGGGTTPEPGIEQLAARRAEAVPVERFGPADDPGGAGGERRGCRATPSGRERTGREEQHGVAGVVQRRQRVVGAHHDHGGVEELGDVPAGWHDERHGAGGSSDRRGRPGDLVGHTAEVHDHADPQGRPVGARFVAVPGGRRRGEGDRDGAAQAPRERSHEDHDQRPPLRRGLRQDDGRGCAGHQRSCDRAPLPGAGCPGVVHPRSCRRADRGAEGTASGDYTTSTDVATTSR